MFLLASSTIVPDSSLCLLCRCSRSRLFHRFFTGSLRHFNILGRIKRLALICPHRRQLRVNVLPSLLPLLHLCQPLANLLQFLLNLQFLSLSANALKLPLVTRVASSENQVIRMVLLERRASRNGNQSCGSVNRLAYAPFCVKRVYLRLMNTY